MLFSHLDLDPTIIKAIEASGFTTPTEVQQQAIPIALTGRDVMASAQTGTGKTAAFVLPALQRLLAPPKHPCKGPRVLILTPTRELARQVSDTIKQLGQFMRISFGTVVGGVPYPPQERLFQRYLDILVATPGRLIDHMEQGRVDFSRLELLILDEADRMLDMGFINDVERIAAKAGSERQTLLFSATLEGEITRIATKLMQDPERIQINSVKQRHDSIRQTLHLADDLRHKKALLEHLLNNPELDQAIVFTATKRGADQLAENLSKLGHQCAALHGDMRQSARNSTVEQLRRKKLRFLVATDVAARGLDVKGISHVINFDLPMVAEDYIHRIGRTGRAGASGDATSLVVPDDWLKLVRIERLTGHRLERQTIVGLEPARPEPRGNGAPRPSNGARRPHTAKPQPRQERYSRGETRGNVEVKFKASNAHGRRSTERSGNLG